MLNKQIVFDKKISGYKQHKYLATPIGYNHYSKILHEQVPKFKSILETYFNDILENGCNGIYKSYYPNGVLQEEYFHNNGEIEGEYKKYYENGKLKETCNYVNGLEHGRLEEFYENGKLKYWHNYLNGNKQLDWRYMTTLIVPKDFPQDKINMLCD